MTKGYIKKFKFNKNILTGSVEKSNKIFNRSCSHRLLSQSELKYLTYNFKKATNFGKLYFLPKIHKRLANCDTPTEKVSEYLDFLLKLVMQDGWSYIKDTGDFRKKIKRLGKVHSFGLDILMTYFLHGYMLKNNLNYFSKTFTSFINT